MMENKRRSIQIILLLTLIPAAAHARDRESCPPDFSAARTSLRQKQEAIKTDATDSPDAYDYNERGVRYFLQARYAEAAACFQKSAGLLPNRRRIITIWATLLKLDKFADAAGSFEKAIQINDKYANAYRGLAEAFAKTNRFAEGVEHIDRALEIEPQNAEFLLTKGNILANLERYDEAIQNLARANELKPDLFQTLSDLSAARFYQGKVEEAIALFKTAVAVNPNYATAYNNLGVALTARKKYRDALAAHRRAVELNPDWSLAVYNLGVAYVYCKNKRAALDVQRSLQSIDSTLAGKLLSSIFQDNLLDVSKMGK